MKFYQIIRKLRKNKGVGIKQAAPDLGLNYTYLSKLENNKSNPSMEVIKKIAKYYNYDEDELFLSAGKIPEDVQEIINNNASAAVQILRKEFGRRS